MEIIALAGIVFITMHLKELKYIKVINNRTNQVYSGTSGLVLPVPNKQAYPEEFQNKSRLTYYASLFNSVEINSSFYKIPMSSTVQKWAESVPSNFQFTFKLWREITHVKGLAFNPDDVDCFMQTIAFAREKKGCLLVQFPPGLKIGSGHRLEKLLVSIKQADPSNDWKVAVEFRNVSWYHEDIYELLDAFGAGLVIHDKTSSSTPIYESSAPFKYLRFHGPGGDYRGSYTDDFLNEYAEYINEWIEEGKTIYVYFNNTVGDAIKNLVTLNDYINLY